MGRSGSSLARGPPVGLGPIREPWPSAGGYKYPLSLEGQVFYSHSKPHSLIATDLSIGEPCRYPPSCSPSQILRLDDSSDQVQSVAPSVGTCSPFFNKDQSTTFHHRHGQQQHT